MRIHIHRLFYGQPRSQGSLLPALPGNELFYGQPALSGHPCVDSPQVTAYYRSVLQ